MVPIKAFGRHYRFALYGTYLLKPGESAGEPIDVRLRDVRWTTPDILLHNGLVASVDVSCTLHVSPETMSAEELYWEPGKRSALQAHILRESLLQAGAEIPLPIAQEQPERTTLGTIFSPFVGSSFGVLRNKLHDRVRKQLAGHGVLVSANSLSIDKVTFPAAIVESYRDFSRSNFEITAGYKFAQRLRVLAPKMSETWLLRICAALSYDSGILRDIFNDGMFSPIAYADAPEVLIQLLPRPVQPAAPSPMDSLRKANPPLTIEDMALLRSLAQR